MADLAEVHLALVMSRFGLPPMRITQILSRIRDMSDAFWPPRLGNNHWLVVSLSAPAGNLTTIDADHAVAHICFVPDEHLIEELRFPSRATVLHALLDLNPFAEALTGVMPSE
jgi:hypothetical protein